MVHSQLWRLCIVNSMRTLKEGWHVDYLSSRLRPSFKDPAAQDFNQYLEMTSLIKHLRFSESMFSSKILRLKDLGIKFSSIYLSFFHISSNLQSTCTWLPIKKGNQSSSEKTGIDQCYEKPLAQIKGKLPGSPTRVGLWQWIGNLPVVPQTVESWNNKSILDKVTLKSQRFYQKDGFPIEDFKFWSGLGRKKFMGLNFVSLFW